MFKVGENRKLAKLVPAVVHLSVIKARRYQKKNKEPSPHLHSHPFSYVKCLYQAHDPQRTPNVERVMAGKTTQDVFFASERDPFSMLINIPHYGYENTFITLELWDRDDELDDDDETVTSGDILVGRVEVPVNWILNGFGLGSSTSHRSRGIFRFVMPGKLGIRSELEVMLAYEHKSDAEADSLRFCAFNFNGRYVLQPDKSTDLSTLHRVTKTPFVVRQLVKAAAESGSDEILDIQIQRGGRGVAMTWKNDYFKESTGPLRIDGLFQSVKTFKGTIEEKRLYWDRTDIDLMVKHTRFPSMVLMAITRLTSHAKNIGEIVEAWSLSPNGKTLRILGMLEKLGIRYQRTYERVPEQKIERMPPPKVATPPGVLTVAIIGGRNLIPKNDKTSAVYAILKLASFENSDKRYKRPMPTDNPDQETRAFPTPNPIWNQVFNFNVESEPDAHNCLVVSVMLRNQTTFESSVACVCRVPVPWLYNSSGAQLGSGAIVSYQCVLKMKRGSNLDPTKKGKYHSGRVEMRFRFKPQQQDDSDDDDDDDDYD
eukprot:TRINITY_DN67718_c7_g21_i1.p1 TRINITY_DN67718_c7_g21~~TRINITY_DN67718_c7_g21_i1.p1  ORF type:complete len:556 (-),score=269.87 TRINITY_DN67718_c7_g21_i1:114-1736(-)